MSSHDESPQIGRIEVDADALRDTGVDLGVILTEFGLDVGDEEVPADAPTNGWRVLHHREEGAVLGAPVDEGGVSWWIASISSRQGSADARRMLVHDRALPLRPSRAERRKGLALRWPDVTRAEPVVDQLAVDIVNTGEERWRPNGDSFHVVCTIQPADALDTRAASFAFIMGQDPAFPLDPGEYARVRVVVDANQWRSLQPGRHHLHAVLAELDVRTDEPLKLELTDELIERHRPRVGPPPPPRSEQRSALRERLSVVRALLAARDRLDAIVEIVVGASSDDEARLGIQKLLDCEPSAAEVVYSASLRRFRAKPHDFLAQEAEELERELANADDVDA